MVRANEKSSNASISTAARMLMEGDLVDPAAGRFSKTIFIVNGSGDMSLEQYVASTAIKNDMSVVSLRFVGEDRRMPRRANLALVVDGTPIQVRDCVPWCAAEDDRIVLVPWDTRDDRHYAVGTHGLEQRAGRPAALLGQGMSRARHRLERAARKLQSADLGSCFTILTDMPVG